MDEEISRRRPSKLAVFIGDATGITLLCTAMWFAYPHWVWKLLACLCGVNLYILGKGLASKE